MRTHPATENAEATKLIRVVCNASRVDGASIGVLTALPGNSLTLVSDPPRDVMTECHRQWPDYEDFQYIILDALFALGKTEHEFSWVTVPRIIRLDAALIDYYYEYLRPKRKPRSVADLHSELCWQGYRAFSHEELMQALAHDDRFEVETDEDCYQAMVKVKRTRQRKRRSG